MKLRALVTAGPTREHIDPVRYLSNGSSGLMGVALAEAFTGSGFDVTLIAGPGVRVPSGLKSKRVVSARDMLAAVRKSFPSCDVFVSCAAVSDYRPRSSSSVKLHKNNKNFMLELVANPDILREMGRRKKHQVVVGFALEDRNGPARAHKKLKEKNCDLIVLNSPSVIDSANIKARVLFPDRSSVKLSTMSKKAFALKLCRIIKKTILKNS